MTKEIRILKGLVSCSIPVENKEQVENIRKGISDCLSNPVGIFTIEAPLISVTYPHLFLANSVIEYPKFD
jgi:hypothetical protein